MTNSLQISGLAKEYKPGCPVLRHIDLTVEGTGLTAIVGPSGTGKSTMLRCINRLIEPTSGTICLTFGGRRTDISHLRGQTLRESRRQIGMVFQEYNLVERLTVMENLLTGRLGYMHAWSAWRRKFPRPDVERAIELLETVGLAGYGDQRADALSGGQRQRVGIARALMQQPNLLLADEPTSSLDPWTSADIMHLLREQGRERAIPVIVNIHDVELAKRFADRVIGMSQGIIVYDGDPVGLSESVLEHIYGGEAWRA